MSLVEGCVATECGAPQQDFWHLLAASLVKDSTGCVRLRVKLHQEECEDIDQYVSCDNAFVSPEELLKLAFGIDECGRVILNLSVSTDDLNQT
jgi:hypothetical protein